MSISAIWIFVLSGFRLLLELRPFFDQSLCNADSQFGVIFKGQVEYGSGVGVCIVGSFEFSAGIGDLRRQPIMAGSALE